jgi:hypothetical protein
VIRAIRRFRVPAVACALKEKATATAGTRITTDFTDHTDKRKIALGLSV